MAKRAGIRKVIKWGGLAVSVLVAVAWVGSCWYEYGWATSGHGYVFMSAGRLCVTEPSWRHVLGGAGELLLDPVESRTAWWFTWGHVGGKRYVYVPLWIPLLIAAGATAAAWRADARERRRQRVNACPACGYDRRGLDAGKVCPECGAAGTNGQMTK